MVGCDQHDKTIVVAGGFTDEERVESNNPDVDTSVLEARHEEADTRIILHCVKSQADSIVVQARDTDILVLLLAHFPRMSCTKLWLKAGTAKKRKYIPVHTIVGQMPFGRTVLETIPAFHALTGSGDILLLRPQQIHCMESLYRASWTSAKSWKWRSYRRNCKRCGAVCLQIVQYAQR